MAEPVQSPSDLVWANRALLLQLGYRERRVLEMRYGLDGDPRPLADVAAVFNVPMIRVTAIEATALEKLRALAESRAWREAEDTVRFRGGAPLDMAARIDLVEYARGWEPGGVEVRYLCPPAPVGFQVAVDNRRKLWRHEPLASPGADQAVELEEA